MAGPEEQEDDFAVDSIDPAPRADGAPGPPDDWAHPSWFDRATIEWWWKGKPDPCPVTPLGFKNGVYHFVSAVGEWRRFTSGQLHNSGGLTDLFGGSLWWPLRHYRKYDLEKKALTGGLQNKRCIAALVRACVLKDYFDDSRPLRSIGVWRGPDGKPIVHAGDRIFHDGTIHPPGVLIDGTLYVIGPRRQAPSYLNEARGGEKHAYSWDAAGPDGGHRVAAILDEFHWEDEGARDLFLGGLLCDMLGDAPLWKSHKFVRAAPGSGKSTLLRFAHALLGGGAHPLLRDYRKAYIEQHFSGTAAALLFEEAEASEGGVNYVAGVFDLVKLLSDDGATGGRGSASGVTRSLDLHGTATMIATVTEDWRTTISSRMSLLELRSLKSRDRNPVPLEVVASWLKEAAGLSARLRARAIARFELFQKNLAIARGVILKLGGTPRDADQLGHLVAGWSTLTSDQLLGDDVNGYERFRPYIVSIVEAEDGEDAPTKCFQTLLGLKTKSHWIGGTQLTIGQVIARAREPDNDDFRRALLAHGLRLEKLPAESWPEAWLAIANNHPGLDELFEKHPAYQGTKRRQILKDLAVTVNGVTHELKPTLGKLRFAGPESRAYLVPPQLLPSLAEEKQS